MLTCFGQSLSLCPILHSTSLKTFNILLSSFWICNFPLMTFSNFYAILLCPIISYVQKYSNCPFYSFCAICLYFWTITVEFIKMVLLSFKIKSLGLPSPHYLEGNVASVSAILSAQYVLCLSSGPVEL